MWDVCSVVMFYSTILTLVNLGDYKWYMHK